MFGPPTSPTVISPTTWIWPGAIGCSTLYVIGSEPGPAGIFIFSAVMIPALGAAVGNGFSGFETSDRVSEALKLPFTVQLSPNSVAAAAPDGTISDVANATATASPSEIRALISSPLSLERHLQLVAG